MAKKRTVFNQMMDAEMERIGAIVPVGRVHKEMEARLAAITEHEQEHDLRNEMMAWAEDRGFVVRNAS